MLTNVKAVLFDLDGTLVDSMWMWRAIDIEYLKKHGYDLPQNLQHEIEGMSFTETAVYFKERFSIPGTLDDIQREWVEMAHYKYKNEVQLKPGVRRFLAALKERGIAAGIATSNNRSLLEAVLKAHNLTEYFGCCMTSCEAGAGKPAPDIYLKVAERLDVDPADCLVFEDIPAGIQAGKRAGMRVCAVSDPYSADRMDKINALADYFIESYDQVLDGTYKELN